MNTKKGQRTVVWVRWYDASYQRGECTLDELVPKVEIESAGILVREDDEFISLALDRYTEDSTWRYIEHIPKVNVRQVKKLSV
jgi:hypothetical protein